MRRQAQPSSSSTASVSKSPFIAAATNSRATRNNSPTSRNSGTGSRPQLWHEHEKDPGDRQPASPARLPDEKQLEATSLKEREFRTEAEDGGPHILS